LACSEDKNGGSVDADATTSMHAASTDDAAANAGGAQPSNRDERDGTVQIADSKLKGSVEDGIHEFLGIRGAARGGLRWRRPQPLAKWSGTRLAQEFGPRCAQNESMTLTNAASDQEDCLYLNV
jgi:para-nitrobenzyl esterase